MDQNKNFEKKVKLKDSKEIQKRLNLKARNKKKNNKRNKERPLNRIATVFIASNNSNVLKYKFDTTIALLL